VSDAATITSIDAIPLAARLRETFRFGTTDRTTSPNVIVAIRDCDGATGYGEACPVPAFTGETQRSIVELVETRVMPVLVGARADHAGPVLARLRRTLFGCPFTQAAADTALLDLLGKRLGVSLSVLLGGACRDAVEVHGSVGWADPGDMARTALDQASTYRWLKLAAKDAAGQREVTAAAGAIKVVADESVFGPEGAASVAADRRARVVNLGLSKLGGPTRAARTATVAAAHSMAALVGSVIELGVATAVGLHLAASLPALPYPSYLMGPLKYAEQITSPVIEIVDGHIAVPSGPGLGVEIDTDALRALDARRQA
jgi:L-alanine-DL-glutamate epimerase-like enolase superfamily enzyme